MARTDPADVARVESRTFLVTANRRDSVPDAQPGVQGSLGNWLCPSELPAILKERFPACMKGADRVQWLFTTRVSLLLKRTIETKQKSSTIYRFHHSPTCSARR